MITSLNNPRIKEVIKLNNKAKARKDAGVFLVEGIRMFREAPFSQVKEVYMTESFFGKYASEDCVVRFKAYMTYDGVPVKKDGPFVTLVSDECMQKMCDTVTPQGVMAVVQCNKYDVKEMLTGEDAFILMIENVQDPGNLGTMIRTAEAAGVTGVIMSHGTVDVYSPKVIRSTMGAIYRMPVAYVPDMPSQVDAMKRLGINVYAACLDGAVDYTEPDYSGRCAIVIGNEGNGLTREAVDSATGGIFIPMAGNVESLNASISAAVLMYEVSRQRRR